MRVAYVDMIGGASGNMLLGALVDAGVDLNAIVTLLKTLAIEGWTIACERVIRRGVAATYVDVIVPGEDDHHDDPRAHDQAHPLRTLDDVLEIFERSQLSVTQKMSAARIAARLAAAEGGEHFHPIGPVDAVIDIAASCIGLELLGVGQLFCSPYPVGLRLPAATQRLLAGAPTRRETIDAEMVTTTGAAILATLVAIPGDRPPMRKLHEGYGAGRSDFPIANVTRIEVGEL